MKWSSGPFQATNARSVSGGPRGRARLASLGQGKLFQARIHSPGKAKPAASLGERPRLSRWLIMSTNGGQSAFLPVGEYGWRKLGAANMEMPWFGLAVETDDLLEIFAICDAQTPQIQSPEVQNGQAQLILDTQIFERLEATQRPELLELTHPYN